MRIAAPQVFLGEIAEDRRLLLPLDVVGGIAACADAVEHVAGAAAGLGQPHRPVPGDDNAAAAPFDAGLHDPDLAARGVNAQPEARQGLVEQDDVFPVGLAVAGQTRGKVNRWHDRFLPCWPRPCRPRPHE